MPEAARCGGCRAAHGGGLALLMKALAVIAGVLQRDAAAKGEALNGRPYFRIFIGLIAELAPANPSTPQPVASP